MAGTWKARQKTETVAVHAHAAVRRDGRALGILESRITGQSGGLALARQLHCLLGQDVPVVIKIQIGNLARQRVGVGQSGAWIGRRVLRNRRGLHHRFVHRRRPQVGGARRALRLTEVDRDRQAAIAVVFDGIDLAQSHGHRQAALQAHVCLGLARAGALGLGQSARDHLLEFTDPRSINLPRGDHLLRHPCVPYRGPSCLSGTRPCPVR